MIIELFYYFLEKIKVPKNNMVSKSHSLITALQFFIDIASKDHGLAMKATKIAGRGIAKSHWLIFRSLVC